MEENGSLPPCPKHDTLPKLDFAPSVALCYNVAGITRPFRGGEEGQRVND